MRNKLRLVIVAKSEATAGEWTLFDHIAFLTRMNVYVLAVTTEEMDWMIQTRVGSEMAGWKARVESRTE